MLRALVCVSRGLEGRSTLPPLERMEGREGGRSEPVRRYLLAWIRNVGSMVKQSKEKKDFEIASRLC